VAEALTERARAAGMDRQEWLRQHFAQLVQLPVVKVSYTFRFFGPQDDVYGYIKRSPTGKIGLQLRPVALLTSEQRLAFRQAGEFVRRNDPGDREKAFKALSGAFEEVYEIPYWNPAGTFANTELSAATKQEDPLCQESQLRKEELR
jgi:hypothetical protein